MRARGLVLPVLAAAALDACAVREAGNSGARAEPPGSRPNILWIVAENMGPDLGCYPDSPSAKLVRTPNLDRFAAEGMRYRLAFSTSPMCSPSRSAFMTGMYQTSIGAHHHRGHRTPGIDDRFHLPPGVRPITHWLKDAGYHTANVATMGGLRVGTGKTDLNFEVEGAVLRPEDRRGRQQVTTQDRHNHENSVRLFHSTEWTTLRNHQPFFAQVNLPTVELGATGWTGSEENPWSGQSHPKRIEPGKVTIPPYYPDHSITRRDWAGYLDAVCGVDDRAGAILKRLEADGLADDTVVIFFGDNGRLEHRGHHWCYDSGDRIPLIIRWPKNFPAPAQYRPGSVNEDLVSLLDLTATTLAVAGIPRPSEMHSRAWFGTQVDPPRSHVFSTRDRVGDVVARCRAVRGPRYRYIRNFTPEVTLMRTLCRYKASRYPVYKLMWELNEHGGLTPVQSALMAERWPDEELYDLERDPYEVENLASSTQPEHRRALSGMRAALAQWMEETNDQGGTPEPPGVLEYWRKDHEERLGTPAWYKGKKP